MKNMKPYTKEIINQHIMYLTVSGKVTVLKNERKNEMFGIVLISSSF